MIFSLLPAAFIIDGELMYCAIVVYIILKSIFKIAEFIIFKILIGLFYFSLCIHNKRSIRGNWFINGFTTEHEYYTLFDCFNYYFISVVPKKNKMIFRCNFRIIDLCLLYTSDAEDE